MGGPGSGCRYHWWRPSRKTVVEACRILDAARWRREGRLGAGADKAGTLRWSWGRVGVLAVHYHVLAAGPDAGAVKLSLPRTGAGAEAWEAGDYQVPLATTQSRSGGMRWWFLCPLRRAGLVCGRRSGKLYLPPGGRYFGCRRCHDLTYASCQRSRKPSGLFRKIARSLGQDFTALRRTLRELLEPP